MRYLFLLLAGAHATPLLSVVDEINAKAAGQWTAGPAKLPLEVMRGRLGVKPESAQIVRDRAAVFQPTPGFAAPLSFDSEKNWPQCAKVIGDIRDQSNCGCCWAFGAAEAASDRMCIATNGTTILPLSAQNMCFCASQDGCNGGDLFTPWAYIQSHGLVTGGQFNGTGPFGGGYCSDFTLPHCHHHGPQGSDPYPAEGQPGCKSQQSARCPTTCTDSKRSFGTDKYSFKGGLVMTYKDEASIQEAIMSGGPVEAAFTVYSDFANYVSGVYKHVTGTMEGGHAIRIVGWGQEASGGKVVKYWKVANSWNKYWGEEGYFRIERGTNECNIESQVTANSPTAKWGPMSA